MSGEELPFCTVQHPMCGACEMDTDHDGESFYCEDCGLDYGDGDDYTPATFRDADRDPCGKACANPWHKSFGMLCETCKLPQGHASMCWTNCKDKERVN